MPTAGRTPFMSPLNFSETDIKHNRTGQMSPHQQARFLRGGKGRALLAAVLGGLSAATLARATQDQSGTTFFAVQVANAVIFGWLTWSLNIALFKDAVGGHVALAIGKPTLRIHKRRQRLYIGNTPLVSPHTLLEVIDLDKTYCAYYAPNSGRLLAIEVKAGSTYRSAAKPPITRMPTLTNRTRTPSTTPRLGTRRWS